MAILAVFGSLSFNKIRPNSLLTGYPYAVFAGVPGRFFRKSLNLATSLGDSDYVEQALDIRTLAAGAKLRMEQTVDLELGWIQRIAEGDREAFEKLYTTYQTRIFRYLLRMTGDTGSAEELTNDTMVAAWKGASGFKGQSKASTWLFAIARNKALNSMRRAQPVTVEIDPSLGLAATDGSPERALHQGLLRDQMQLALAQLSPEHREVVELTFYEGLSYPEIAEIVHCPVNTVKTRMFYAKKKIQEFLKGRGFGGEEP